LGVRPDIAAAFCQDVFPRLNSLIGCRMTSTDKGILAKTLKDHTGEVVLAIGDGANDVQMIQMANVGVGIYGVDGAQAIQASDYGVVSFKCLWKLLFVHGHWSYTRVSELLLLFYYKNLLFVVPQFLFCLFNGWSSQTLFDDYYIVLFHLLFTAVPLIARGAFDQNVYYKKWTSKSKTSLLENKNLVEYKLLRKFYPRLYYVGQQNTVFR
jgi:phospholipid-transporting ATPase